jgi:hypothetical protein
MSSAETLVSLTQFEIDAIKQSAIDKPFARQISAHPLPRPLGEGIKKPKFEVR